MSSADKCDPDALGRLGECYSAGIGVAANENTAFQYYRLASELGNPKAMCSLGLHYLRGQGCRQDTELGFSWISAAIDTGFPIVFQMLQHVGLDIEKISAGYKRLCKIQTAMTGDRFGGNMDRIFADATKLLMANPPSEGSEGQERWR